MGTDIHIYVEYYDADEEKWQHMTDRIFENIWFNPAKAAEREDEFVRAFYGQKYTTDPIQGRWYDLFGKLANVRNRHGFKPLISSDIDLYYSRGIPDNISEGVLAIIADENASHWWHHPNYLYLNEILNLSRWRNTVRKTGICSLDSFLNMDSDGGPDQYATYVSGPFVEVVDSEKMDEYIENGFPEGSESTEWYVRVEWDVEELSYFRRFIKNILKLYSHFRKKGITNMKHIRLVFWFDS